MKIRCEMCGKKFDSDDARSRYDSEWGDSWARLWLLTNLILFLFIFREKFKAYNEGITLQFLFKKETKLWKRNLRLWQLCLALLQQHSY